MNSQLRTRLANYKSRYQEVVHSHNFNVDLLENQLKKQKKIREEQDLAVRSLQALKDVRPLLAVSAIKQAEDLANSALKAIFDFPAQLQYDEEDGRFYILHPEGEADLQEGSGGGLQAVVSFVFQTFLLMKEGARHFMAFDEAFTQLSDEALVRFIEFVNTLCEQLDFDIILISHDSRITPEMCRHLYRIEEGHAVKEK